MRKTVGQAGRSFSSMLLGTASILLGVVLLFTDELYVWQLETTQSFGKLHWLIGLLFISFGLLMWLPPERIIAAFKQDRIRNRILGIIALLWGGSILAGQAWSGRLTLEVGSQYALGESAGTIFAVGLILAGLWALLRRR